MMKHVISLGLIFLVVILGALFYLTRPDEARLAYGADMGRVPQITSPRSQWIPVPNIAEAVGWKTGETPTPANGLDVVRFAEGLAHPRSMLKLPNGDVLVAETGGPKREPDGIVDRITAWYMKKAGAGGAPANRITLLRDADGDGKAELKTAFLTGLNSPYGMALVGDRLYVANTDSLISFPYKEGDTKISDAGRKVMNLPAQEPNMHWSRNLVASPDGKLLYVAVGSNSNIGENGLDTEDKIGRAHV
jgi:glucose/arabinose dehydrogenase